jgi:hypothetical protein
MDGIYNWDVFHHRDGSTVLVDRHLNFDVRYDVDDTMVVTGKTFRFHIEQLDPCIALCRAGKCENPLCQLKKEELENAMETFDHGECRKDPIVGRLVKARRDGFTFMDQDGGAISLDMNWRRLRNLARPIIDAQLAKLAISGEWKNNKVFLNLGTLMIDNTMVRVDGESYAGMTKEENKSDLADMEACQKSWNKKLVSIILKRDIEKEARGDCPKRRKTQMAAYLDGDDDFKNNDDDNTNDKKLKSIGNTVNATDESKGKEEKQLVVREDLSEEGEEAAPACEYCCENPCVWG